MKVVRIALTGAILSMAQASPVVTRAAITDADILNYALTLEHLEATFYEEGLKNYTQSNFVNAGFKDPFYTNLQEVAADERTHVAFLTQALTTTGASPVKRCTYSFPSTDVKTFLALASVLEGVGVSAYLGAAASIANKGYLTAAGSILTPFDDPLDFDEVYAVASPFIISCPSSNGKLPVKASPSLTLTTSHAVVSGSKVHLMAGSGFDDSKLNNLYAAFITVTGPIWTSLHFTGDRSFTATIPKGVAGQSYIVITKGKSHVTDDNIVAGPAIIEVDYTRILGYFTSVFPQD
ncbi:peptidase S15 [Penicillium atrosanguineum]|uniref:peptidase S15 n=1 Tax=Penicillium atrosanguineum TaxID=1132637 RepID=UPI0023A3FFDA|nr:peptidase S15 [Penicillium atrosanguineum]KAJ5292247.1 peptidase S15 [Penicillium atrosanguineum]